jgi:hypothetical protein
LQLLERSLLVDETLPSDRCVDYAAAVATIRQMIEALRHERAILN